MPLGPDFLPDFDKIDVQELRDKRAKVSEGRAGGEEEGRVSLRKSSRGEQRL